MNVLIVTLHYLNGNGGGVFASRAFANAIASVADATYLMYPLFEGDDTLRIDSKIRKIPVLYKKSKLAKFVDLLLGRVHRYYGSFEKELCSIKPDVVVFDNSRASYGLIDIAKRNGCKVVTIHHNYEYEYNRDNFPLYLKDILLFWTKRYERDAVRKSDLNLTLTRQDSILLANHYNDGRIDSFEVIGVFEYEKNVQRLSDFNLLQHANGLNFVITGNLSAKQTEKSLISWFEDYYPILKKKIPEATLVVAGKKPSAFFKQKCMNLGVNLVPSPKTMDEILDKGDVYVCPISLGGGIKLRVMDGLKKGLPVIAHEVSARGYDDFEQLGMLFAYRNEKSFDDCLEQILKHKCDRNDVINAYEKLFSFDAGEKRLRKALNRLF